MVRRLAEGGAVAVPLLNGVEAFESLLELGVPADRMLAGLAVISAEKTAPGIITRKSDFRRIVVGERGGGSSDRADRVAEVFRETGAEARASADITVDLWRKFLFLTTLAAACGLARVPVGDIRDAPLGPEPWARGTGDRGRRPGARRCAPGRRGGQILPTMAALPGTKPSFLLDLERGGPTKLTSLSGAVSRYRRSCGIPTPIHDAVVAAFGRGVGADLRHDDG